MLEQTGERFPSEAHQGGANQPITQAPSPLRRSGRRLWRAAALACLGLAAAGVAVAVIPPLGGSTPVASSGEAAIGGPFHLVDETGRPVDQHVLDGRWSAVFFGYTNCPDTCPATLQALNAAGQQLAAARRRGFQVVFISVDPARDTPAEMRLYDRSQGYPAGGLLGLTGTPAQIASVAGEYHVFYKAGTGSDYAVQHSAAIYLMDPQGRFVKPLDETQPPVALAQQIRDAMGA